MAPETRFEFLRELYLPGFMGLQTEDYRKREATFDFLPIEPQVTAIQLGYVTPRGTHIFVSQAGLCLVEQTIITEGFDMSPEEFRKLTMGGMMKITELNGKYRKELRNDEILQGRMKITRIRWGSTPVVRMDYGIGNGAARGNMEAILASEPVPQMNADILRNS